MSAGSTSRVPTTPLHKMLKRKEWTRNRKKDMPQNIVTILKIYVTNYIL